jgi:hypothetical protein
MDILTPLYYFILLIAAITGVVCVARKKTVAFHIQLLAYIVAFDFVADISAWYWLTIKTNNGNAQAYNFINLVELMLYALYFLQIIRSVIVRRLIKIFLCLFPLCWFFMVYFIYELTEWNAPVTVLGSAFTVFWAAVYLFELFISTDNIKLHRIAEFWVAVAILIFYPCYIPIIGLFNFAHNNFSDLTNVLLKINAILNIVMYLLFTYAFILNYFNNEAFEKFSD